MKSSNFAATIGKGKGKKKPPLPPQMGGKPMKMPKGKKK